jgi:2-keto-4-pentenoate hydratase/2-oxohepta-3-ene-1,7-dioic acid hydratase in catechol pathway
MSPQRPTLSSACLLLAAALTLAATGSQAAAPAATPLLTRLAPIATAHTFAQTRQGDAVSTLLVLALSGDRITALDLSAASGLYSADAFDVINRFTAAELDALAAQARDTRSYALTALRGVGPRGLAHIAAGTNYPAHGEEVGIDDAFLFPKLSQATGPRTTIVAAPGVLLDYEVEVCARFDREIRSMADFDAARKGLFLCGDFSDRAAMMRNLNLRDIRSGDGFADAKSGPDRFPAGPFLVVPRDWRPFLAGVVIDTHVDGQRRQHANAGDMIKDLRTIVQETLDAATTRTWSFQGGRIAMTPRPAIGTDSAILTGTGDGVVFQQPGPDVMKALAVAPDRAGQRAVIDRYIAAQDKRRIYLQPGNRVRYTSNYLGSIDTAVVAPSAGAR